MTVRFVVIVPFTRTVKEYKVNVWMYGCIDAFIICVFVHCHQSVCVGFFPRLSLTLFSVFVSFSSLFFLFQCFVGDVYLLHCCALSAACALYVIRVQFY